MKIGMMSAWNQDSGVSVHAELIGREWLKMGQELKVFSFLRSDFHGNFILKEDEDYVVRCFTTSRKDILDPWPLLKSDFDIFVTQDLGMLPQDELGKIFHHIRGKAKTITVIHDSALSSQPSFYQFRWDAIVCFDERYYNFLRKVYPLNQIHIIPFPCHPLKRGDKREARYRFSLPQDKKILLIFGQRLKEHLSIFPQLSQMAREYPFLLLVVSQIDLKEVKKFEGKIEIELREESPDIERLYEYLHASDVLLLHRKSVDGVAVSSTVFQCLGSGCPILALDSNFFENLDQVVLKYRNFDEFKENLLNIFQEGEKYRKNQEAVEKYLKERSAEKIAFRYLKLFSELKGRNRLSRLC